MVSHSSPLLLTTTKEMQIGTRMMLRGYLEFPDPTTDRIARSFPPVRERRVRRRSRNPAHLLFPISGLLLGLPWAGERGCISAIAFSLSPCGWCEAVRFAAEDSGLPRIIAAVQVHISTRDT